MGKTSESKKKVVAVPSNGKEKKAAASRSSKAGLTMPVSRVNRHLKLSRVTERVGCTTPVFMACVLEYVMAEVLELAGNQCLKEKRKRVSVADIVYAIRTDKELHKLTEGFRFFTGDKLQNVSQAVTLEPEKVEKVRNGEKLSSKKSAPEA